MKLKGTLAPKENHEKFYKRGKATTRATVLQLTYSILPMEKNKFFHDFTILTVTAVSKQL